MALANRLAAPLIFATDPDGDRFAVAEKFCGQWHFFTGDQIAVLLGIFAWRHRHRLFRVSPKHCIDNDDDVRWSVIASKVSSRMLQAVGQVEGFDFVTSSTGFKNIAKAAAELKSQKHCVFFAFEEAIGT